MKETLVSVSLTDLEFFERIINYAFENNLYFELSNKNLRLCRRKNGELLLQDELERSDKIYLKGISSESVRDIIRGNFLS